MVRMVQMVVVTASDGGSTQIQTSTAFLLRGVRLQLLALLLHTLHGGLAGADDGGVLVALGVGEPAVFGFS